jgi:hypothetical protein
VSFYILIGIFSDLLLCSIVSACTNGICPKGSCWNNQTSSCELASAGTFSDQTSLSTCRLCSPGLFSSKVGSSECDSCGLGLYSGVNGSTSCQFCSLGKFANQTNRADCYDCPIGKWSLNVGATDLSDCSVCAAGYESFDSSCITCTPGKHAMSPDSNCTFCIPGKYSSQFNSSTCDLCARGYFSPLGSSSCDLCPKGSTTSSDTLATSLNACYCVRGSFGKAYSGEDCYPCTEEYTICDHDNYTVGFILPGYWKEPQSSNVLKCIPSNSCAFTGLNSTTICAPGYTGRKCGSCVPQSHYRIGGVCLSCGSEAMRVVVYICSFLAVFILFFWLLRSKGKRIPTVIRVAFYWVQLMSTLPYLMDSWPPKLLSFLQVMAISNLNLDVASPGRNTLDL